MDRGAQEKDRGHLIIMKTFSRGGLLALLALLLLSPGCDNFPDEFPAADFTLPDMLGDEPIRMADYRGRPLIIYWLTSW